MDDIKFGVPAGWYPDPLGLPQLRWWDALAWTEHTSEARAPIVIAPAPRLGFADDELPERVEEYAAVQEQDVLEHDEEMPSRREQRERERRANGIFGDDPAPDSAPRAYLENPTPEPEIEREELSAQPLLAMTLRELEPPPANTVDDITPGPRRATEHTGAVLGAATVDGLADEPAPERAAKQKRTYTISIWIIALMPALQLVVSILLLAVFGLGMNMPIMVLVWIAPYFIVIGLAAYDKLELGSLGHSRPAGALWAILLAGPGFLAIRAYRTLRETGKGIAPLMIWLAAVVSVLFGIIAVPGLIIAVFPAVFADQAASSVEQAASVLGAKITVNCPAPPVIIGEIFTCIRTDRGGQTDSLAISLQRANGWISWRVEDWGTTVMASLK